MEDRNKDEYRLKTAAVIYQSFNLFSLLTALENDKYPLQIKKIPKKKAEVIAKENCHYPQPYDSR